MVETLGGAGNVIRIFCGHAHQARSVRVDGIPASTMPSIAVDLRMGEDRRNPSPDPRFQLHRFDPSEGFITRSIEVPAAAPGTTVQARKAS